MSAGGYALAGVAASTSVADRVAVAGKVAAEDISTAALAGEADPLGQEAGPKEADS